MLRKLKTKLGFIYRGCLGIKDNIFDTPKIDRKIEKFSIGKTINGQDIQCYTFGKGKEKILYFGGIHGNEVGTVKLMNRWGNYLNSKLGNTNLNSLQNKQIFIIPCLNLDGNKKAYQNPEYFSGGRYGKTNGNDVDLNRNFPTANWSEKSKLFAAGEYRNISGGAFAGSEPEIQTLLELIKKEEIQTVYTFHNCWGTTFGRGSNNVQTKVKSYSKHSGYRTFLDFEWNNLKAEQKTGHMMIWAKEQKIDVIEIETKMRWGSEWKTNKNALIESLKL